MSKQRGNRYTTETRERTTAEREMFAKYCRAKGTRIDRIMTEIERGLDLADVAARYHTTLGTVRVYQKALRNELCVISDSDGELDDRAAKYDEPPAYFCRPWRCNVERSEWPYGDMRPQDRVPFDLYKLRQMLKARGMTEPAMLVKSGLSPRHLYVAAQNRGITMLSCYKIYRATGLDLMRLGILMPTAVDLERLAYTGSPA